MGARDLLDELACAGLSVTADGDRLVIRPGSRLTDDMRMKLRTAKPELLVLLAQHHSQPDRPYKLTPVEANATHASPWDDRTIARFVARVGLFMRRGLHATNADDLAERLTLRDRGADDRVLCLECTHYRPGQCGNGAAAGLAGPDVGLAVATRLQRCPGFAVSEDA